MKVFTCVLLLSGVALAEEDASNLYAVSTDGSTAKLKAGEKGKLVLTISAKQGAHISDEAPLKVELSAQGATLEKQKLAYADSLNKKTDKAQYPDPKFEVGFTAEKAGKAQLDAKVTFFVCTEKKCVRQQKTMNVPVEVN